MPDFVSSLQQQTRRHFLERCPLGLAGMFLATQSARAAETTANPLAPKRPTFPAKAKAVHLSPHGWWSVPTGAIRLQTRADQV